MPYRVLKISFLSLLLTGLCLTSYAGIVVREELESGVYAALRGGRVLYLECHPPAGDAAKSLLQRYLAEPESWKHYRNRDSVAIPFVRLKPQIRRQALLALFPDDYVDESGWWHTVVFQGTEGVETWWILSEWLTGLGTYYKAIAADPHNEALGDTLQAGQKVLIPRALLLDEMKPPTRPIESNDLLDVLPVGNGVLKYSEDKEGPYAIYHIQKGEALYTDVVVRFTDFRENDEIHRACEIIQTRSGIKDVCRMEAGDRVLIPQEMLSDRYQPAGSAQRVAYEEVQKEAQRLQDTRVATKDLEGVVIVLDPGHGGRDQGAAVKSMGLYEDELAYDMVCRIKHLLETQTRARIYITMRDESQQYESVDLERFAHDRDEYVLTTPPYKNNDAKVSANLRWYLANDIYKKELAQGTDPQKILFASIHCDALYNGRLRGAMVYVPGAQYRRSSETPSGTLYNRYAESRNCRTVTHTVAECRRDEALSRNFASNLLSTMRHNNPPLKVHSAGDPIRNVIRRSKGRSYVPAVLRNTKIPTKVLIETANMTNTTDQQRLADPKWRQWFAEAFVTAVTRHFEAKKDS